MTLPAKIVSLNLEWLVPVLLNGVLLVKVASADMQFADHNPNVHNRFDDDRMGETFIGDGFDWSGVGKQKNSETSFSRWATLISDRHFLSASHLHPSIGEDVRFWENNSLSSPSHDREVIGGQRIGNTDLWLGTLASAVPDSITHYQIPTDLITTFVEAGCLDSYANVEVFTVGKIGPRSFGIGKNRYDVVDDTAQLNGDYTAVGFIEDLVGDTHFIADHETFLQTGDSGAPSFQVNGSSLELVGIHAYITDGVAYSDTVNLSDFIACRTSDSSLSPAATMVGRMISYDNFVPESRSAILAATAVPEPPAWALLTIVVVGTAIAGSRRFG